MGSPQLTNKLPGACCLKLHVALLAYAGNRGLEKLLDHSQGLRQPALQHGEPP